MRYTVQCHIFYLGDIATVNRFMHLAAGFPKISKMPVKKASHLQKYNCIVYRHISSKNSPIFKAATNKLRHLFYVIIWCYHFSQFANVIIFVLSFFLVQDGCYHLCYHLMLSFFVIISSLSYFSWKRDTLTKEYKIEICHKTYFKKKKGNILS